MDNSKIEWTDATWNAVTGCQHVSPGCDNCYAETFANRFKGVEGNYFEPGFEVTLRPGKLLDPYRWRKGRAVFVNSLSDVFHAKIPDMYRWAMFGVMATTPRHTYQILTKRPALMRKCLSGYQKPGSEAREPLDAALAIRLMIEGLEYAARLLLGEVVAQNGNPAIFPLRGAEQPPRPSWLPEPGRAATEARFLRGLADTLSRQGAVWPLPNLHLGVSAETLHTWRDRVYLLARTPAAHRFVSCEPLLERLPPYMPDQSLIAQGRTLALRDYIGWVIVGGESGPGARPCRESWIRTMVEGCRTEGVPVFVKQLGKAYQADSSLPEDVVVASPLRHPKGGDMAEWPEDLRVREVPTTRTLLTLPV